MLRRVAFVVPGIESVYVDDDDPENDEVIPELQAFFDEVAVLGPVSEVGGAVVL